MAFTKQALGEASTCLLLGDAKGADAWMLAAQLASRRVCSQLADARVEVNRGTP